MLVAAAHGEVCVCHGGLGLQKQKVWEGLGFDDLRTAGLLNAITIDGIVAPTC